MLILSTVITITCGIFVFKYHSHICDFRVNGDSNCQDQKTNDWSDIFRESMINFSNMSLIFEGLLIFCSLALYVQLYSLSSPSAAEETPVWCILLCFIFT